MKKKKIAFITPNYLPALLFGSDNAVRILAEDFVKAGHKVTIITSDAATPRYWYDPFFGKKIPDQAPTKVNGVNIVRLKSNQFISALTFIVARLTGRLLPSRIRGRLEIISNGPYLIGLGEVLQSGTMDVVHCSPFPLNINKQVVDAVSKLEKKPKVIFTPFFHTHVSTYHNRELARLVRQADVIHAVTHAEKQDLESIFPEAKGKVHTIPLYLPTASLHRPSELQKDVLKIKEKYHLVGKKIVLLAGLKGQMKGALDTLAAVEQLHKSDPTIFLAAIGHSTVEWNALKERIHPDGLLDFDYIDEYAKELFFSACDIYCMPSKSESFGYVYLEAWHKRKPVIAADIPAMQELIAGNKGGVLVKFGKRTELVEAIKSLIDDKSKSLEYGNNGYHALMGKYAYKVLIRKYLNLFS